MAERDIEQEIEANNQRKEAAEADRDDDDTLVDIVEDAFTPVTDAIARGDLDRDEEPSLAEARRIANDESQSPE